MSKMSQLHADLTEQAADLGFGSIGEAEANGYVVDYENKTLKRDAMASLSLAHEAWEERRKWVVNNLEKLYTTLHKDKLVSDQMLIELSDAIEFVRWCRDGS